MARNTPLRLGPLFGFVVKAGVTIERGTLVVLEDGMAIPGKPGANLVAVGRAEMDGVGNGEYQITVRSGIFKWSNSSGADQIGRAEVGKDCFVVDEGTVAKTNTGSRPRAGIVVDIETDGVWVQTGLGL